jgi:hypothetical protein
MAEETGEEILQNSIRLKHMMMELKENVNFRRYQEEMKKQIEQRTNDVFGFPSGGLDTVVKNIYTTGEIAGLRMSLVFADILIDYMQMNIDTEKKNQEDNLGTNENG